VHPFQKFECTEDESNALVPNTRCLYMSWAVLWTFEHDNECMQAINTLELRLHRFPDPSASLAASVSWSASTLHDLPWRVSTTSSCCLEPVQNLTWWNIAEDVRVPSVQSGRSLYPLQRVCVSLFDVSERRKSVRCENNRMRRYGTLCSCKPLFRS